MNIVKASSLTFSWSVKSGFLYIFNRARLKQRRGFTVCHRGPHYSHINHVTGWKEQLKREYSYEFQYERGGDSVIERERVDLWKHLSMSNPVGVWAIRLGEQSRERWRTCSNTLRLAQWNMRSYEGTGCGQGPKLKFCKQPQDDIGFGGAYSADVVFHRRADGANPRHQPLDPIQVIAVCSSPA